MDKQVENCEIRIKPESTQIIFQIKFVNSSIKKYYLPVIENDQLEAQIPTDQPNQICASSKFLSASLKNFRYSEDEITIVVNKDKMVIKNHLELRRDLNSMRTELCYHQTEFESYVVENPTNVTFCLKELRAAVMFAEPANLPIILSFNEPGRPIVFQVMNHPAYEANYVVSTLQSSHADKSSRLSGSQNIDSPVTTPISQGIKRNSKSSTPYSFVEEESSTPCIPRKKQDTIRSNVPSTPEPIPSTSYQTSIEKSLQQFLSNPGPSKEMGKESEPSKLSVEIGSFQTASLEPVLSDANLPFLNEGPSTSQVVPESEPALSITHGTPEGSLCRVDTVIKGMDSSSQPSPELLKTVFSRCFSKDHFLNVLVGHDVVLEESSDREAS
ncbi:cell cycle checkpoint control protein RAD9A isoform X2 [Halyomorpha halys]